MSKECKNAYCPFCGGCKAEATCNNFMAEEPKNTCVTTTGNSNFGHISVTDVTPKPEWFHVPAETSTMVQKQTFGITDTYIQIKTEDYLGSPNVDGKLPTSEEYRKSAKTIPWQINMFSEPKYICPKCGGGMCKNNMVVLTSYPPQYEYQCDKCGNIEYQYK